MTEGAGGAVREGAGEVVRKFAGRVVRVGVPIVRCEGM